MSCGFGASARIVKQDENIVVYEYAPYDLNVQEYSNREHIYDGMITISKDSVVEPALREKFETDALGRKKLIVKRIRSDVDYTELLHAGKNYY